MGTSLPPYIRVRTREDDERDARRIYYSAPIILVCIGPGRLGYGFFEWLHQRFYVGSNYFPLLGGVVGFFLPFITVLMITTRYPTTINWIRRYIKAFWIVSVLATIGALVWFALVK